MSIPRIFTVPGKPLGKQRPRVTKAGSTYTPQQTVNYEAFIKECYIQKYSREKPFERSIRLEIKAYYPIPSSASKSRKKGMENNNIRPTVKPDADNILKIVSDALNSIAYADDKQIVECKIEKFYSSIPRLEIEIEEVS